MDESANTGSLIMLQEMFDEIKALCTINVDDIGQEIAEHTLNAEEVARQHAMAVDAYTSWDHRVKQRKAAIYLKLRAEKTAKDPEKCKYSEKEIEAYQDTDPGVIEARNARGVAQAAKTYMDDVAHAYTQSRGTMLVNIRKLADAEVEAQSR